MIDNTIHPKSDGNGVYSSCFRCGWYSRGYIQTCPTCTQLGLQKQIAKNTAQESPYAAFQGTAGSNEPTGFSLFIGRVVAFCILASLGWYLLGELWQWVLAWPTWIKWTVGIVVTSPIWAPILGWLDKIIMES